MLLNQPATRHLEEDLRRQLGHSVSIQGLQTVSAGDSHKALRVDTAESSWFVKWNASSAYPALAAEAEGLTELSKLAPDAMVVPQPLCVSIQEPNAWLILPWFELHNHGDTKALGAALAELHRCSAPSFGWSTRNFLGASAQKNDWQHSWKDFWWQCRLLPQLELAETRGGAEQLSSLRPALKKASNDLLTHDPEPALVHGDLWSGNHAFLANGTPVLFDAAPYFGDRETDLAMMRLFGGFAPEVFEAYKAQWPLSQGSAKREPLYQLYHLLNHLNIFGSGWLPRVQQAIINVLN